MMMINRTLCVILLVIWSGSWSFSSNLGHFFYRFLSPSSFPLSLLLLLLWLSLSEWSFRRIAYQLIDFEAKRSELIGIGLSKCLCLYDYEYDGSQPAQNQLIPYMYTNSALSLRFVSFYFISLTNKTERSFLVEARFFLSMSHFSI